MDTTEKHAYEAYVTVQDGKTILIDPVAYAMMQAINKRNCESIYLAQIERVQHFKKRISEKNLDPESVVITLINVDAPYGLDIADALMPGYDWQQFRDRGEVPFARGLAMKEGVAEMIALFDKEASDKIATVDGVAVVVVDFGVAEVFSV